jgi:hypothetical protein
MHSTLIYVTFVMLYFIYDECIHARIFHDFIAKKYLRSTGNFYDDSIFLDTLFSFIELNLKF